MSKCDVATLTYLSLLATLLALIPASVLRWLWEVWKKTKLG
jgi:hypothetical protein